MCRLSAMIKTDARSYGECDRWARAERGGKRSPDYQESVEAAVRYVTPGLNTLPEEWVTVAHNVDL